MMAMPPALPVTLRREVLLFVVVNYVSYSWWTLLNKALYESAAKSGGMLAAAVQPTPLLSTAVQMATAATLAAIVVLGFGVQRNRTVSLCSPDIWVTRILPLGLSRAVDIGCGNVALSLVSVALQQIVKATLPIFVTILTVLVLRRRVTRATVASLLPIVVGTVLASLHDMRLANHASSNLHRPGHAEDSVAGALIALLSCFGRAAKAVLNALLLRPSAEKLNPLEVVLLEAPTTALLLLVPALLMEGPGVWNGTRDFLSSPTVVGMNLWCGVLMFITQYAYVTLIEMTSALTCQVLMSIKMLLLVFLSVWLLDTPFTLVNALGVLLAGGGCLMYAAAERAATTSTKKCDDVPVL